MILIKQLVQKSIEKYHEAKLSGKDAYKLYYFAYGLSSVFLNLAGKLEIDEKQVKLRNIVYKTLFDDMIKQAVPGKPEEIKDRYEKMSSKLKKDFQSLMDNDLNTIAKFLDETIQIQQSDESYGITNFRDDTLGVIETSYSD